MFRFLTFNQRFSHTTAAMQLRLLPPTIVSIALPAVAGAHVGDADPTADALWKWSFAPEVALPLLVITLLYRRGLRRRAQAVRPVSPEPEPYCFAAGLLVVAIALLSPLDALAADLASAHMLQHMLLIAIAPPLLAQGAPMRTLFWGLSVEAKRPAGRLLQGLSRAGGWFAGPMIAGTLHAIVIWAWHAPALYAAALAHDWVHTLDHMCLFGSGLLFWHAVLKRVPREAGFGLGIVALLVTTIHTGMLGALMTFSGGPWYRGLAGRTEAYGLSPLEDQQLAGLIMWVPMGFVYVGAAVILGGAWFAAMDRRRAAMESRRTQAR
jgi:putative membrane protein